MNPDQKKNLFRTAEVIAEHLVYAWNYTATLRALQRHARECPDVLDQNRHFISTITYAMWDALFLKLSHCSDKGRKVTGFPKLFKQLRAYLPEGHRVLPEVRKQESRLIHLDAQTTIENWRNQVVAHHTVTGDFDEFYKKNVCSLDEVERLVSDLCDILHAFTIPIWNQEFLVKDLGTHAQTGVDQLVSKMKLGAEQTGIHVHR